jgi:hypothetical protein
MHKLIGKTAIEFFTGAKIRVVGGLSQLEPKKIPIKYITEYYINRARPVDGIIGKKANFFVNKVGILKKIYIWI